MGQIDAAAEFRRLAAAAIAAGPDTQAADALARWMEKARRDGLRASDIAQGGKALGLNEIFKRTWDKVRDRGARND